MNYRKKITFKTVLTASLFIIVLLSCTDEPPVPQVSEISIKTPPAKVLYKPGEELDLSGLVVTLTYDNKETKDIQFNAFHDNGITSSRSNGVKITEAIVVEITHTESGKNTTQKIGINEVAEVIIKTAPTSVNYLIGEKLNYSGLEITLKRDNKDEEVVAYSQFASNGLEISPADGEKLVEGLTSFTVKHTRSGKMVTQNISIRTVSSLSVKTPPSKIEYYAGELLNINGLSIVLNLDNGSTRTLALSDFASYNVVTSLVDGAELKNENSKFAITHVKSGQTTNQLLTLLKLTDIEGNIYAHVKIGKQIWMAENLKTKKFKNGDAIATTANPTLDISNEIHPQYQWAYDANESNVPIYGRLYTKYVTADSRGVCPAGWHVPGINEFSDLQTYLIAGGFNYDNTTTGNKIGKALASTTNWQVITWAEGSPGNIPADNNRSGFNGVASGARINFDVYFLGQTGYTYWWSTNSDADDNGKAFRIQSFQKEAEIVTIGDKNSGAPIRCLLNQ
jgi:uncharacterized protein (TIGR02145 family)